MGCLVHGSSYKTGLDFLLNVKLQITSCSFPLGLLLLHIAWASACSHSHSLGMLCVGDSVPDDILKENLFFTPPRRAKLLTTCSVRCLKFCPSESSCASWRHPSYGPCHPFLVQSSFVWLLCRCDSSNISPQNTFELSWINTSKDS